MSSTLLVTFDPGTSDSKIIYRCNQERTKLLLMPPFVSEIKRNSLNWENALSVESLPENRAWVDFESKCYAVGYLASKNAAFNTVSFDLKYEEAVVKVLAAVGVIAAKEELPREFELALSVPLPYSELEDRRKFHDALREALLDFGFAGINYSVALDYFQCISEGSGHLMLRVEKLGNLAPEKQILSLMLGFRDLSLVYFDRGSMTGNTVPLGMAKLIEKVRSRTSGQDVRNLTETIAEAKSLDPKWFEHLVRSRQQQYQKEEVVQIVEVVKQAKDEYWQQVKNYLDKYLIFYPDEIIIGGGTAYYLRNELKTWLDRYRSRGKKKVEISWSASLEKDVQITFGMLQEREKLSARLTDAYALFLNMQKQVEKIKRARKWEEI